MKKVMLLRTKPYQLLCYEALFRWLHPRLRDNKILQDDYASYRAGYHGEKNSDYVVLAYPHKNAHIYQGLRLKVGPFYFQIDTLIVTPMYMLILEIKNLKGELEYNGATQQLVQLGGDEKKSQKNPILQAEAQKRHLMSWLQQSGFPPIPIETVGVSSNPASILTYKDEINSDIKFVQLDVLPTIFDNLSQKFSKRLYEQTTLQKLSRKLLKENIPFKPDLISQYNINKRHLIKGIACDECNHFPMKYKYPKWLCSNCGKENKIAHKQKILDYFLLFEPVMSNKICREILQIDSIKIARRMLYSLNLEYTGKNSGRRYYSPPLEKFPQDSYSPYVKRSIFND